MWGLERNQLKTKEMAAGVAEAIKSDTPA